MEGALVEKATKLLTSKVRKERAWRKGGWEDRQRKKDYVIDFI